MAVVAGPAAAGLAECRGAGGGCSSVQRQGLAAAPRVGPEQFLRGGAVSRGRRSAGIYSVSVISLAVIKHMSNHCSVLMESFLMLRHLR